MSKRSIRMCGWPLAIAAVLVMTARAFAHPTPFTYVDLRPNGARIDVTVSAHVLDVAHDLALASPEISFQDDTLADVTTLVRALLERLNLRVNEKQVSCGEPTIERLVETKTIRGSFRCEATGAVRTISVNGPLFPYDPEHRTFVNLYVDGALAGQAALDQGNDEASFEVWRTQSRLETIRRFLIAGFQHILGGPDHLLFLAGLLLIGGTIWRLTAIVTAFTVAHSVTLALAVLGVLTPPPALIEPLIALSIVFVGVNNLRGSDHGKWRVLTAGAFGLIHGFGFAYALREMQLARRDLGWSLFSFNLGVEVGQLAVVLVLASLLYALHRYRIIAQRRIVVVGSIVVAAAGAFWFVQRILAIW